MDINQLLQFRTIAECGTIAKAAEQLHISQPALSRNLQRLEAECGTPLFDRVKKRLILNEAGRISLSYVAQILKCTEDMRTALDRYCSQGHTLRVSTCAPTPMIYLLSELGVTFPEVSIQISWKRDRDLKHELLNGSADFVISAISPTTPGIDSLPFMKEALVMMFPPSHPLAGKTEVSLSDLDGEPIFQYGSSGFWNELCQSKLQKTTIWQVPEFMVFQEMLRSSNQATFITDAWISLHPEFAQMGRVLVPLTDPCFTVTYYLCSLSERRKQWQPLLKTIKPFQH